MKQLSIFMRVILLFAVIGFFSSCESDETTTDSPIVTLGSGADYVSGSTATVSSGETFKVLLKGTKGSNPMNSLEILADGTKLPTDRFTIDGVTDNNPKLLFDSDKSSFSYEISIVAQASGDTEYEFVVKDEGSKSSGKESITISIDAQSVAPVVSIFGASDVEINSPTIWKMEVDAEKGGAALSSIAVYEDNELIVDVSRLYYNSVNDNFTANPMLLPDGDKDGFMNDIYVKTHVSGTKTYTVKVVDEAGAEGSASVTLTIKPAGTPISNEWSNVKMYNNSGPNNGAIDLETGSNVSSNSSAKDIVDAGNDGGEWAKQITPVAGTDLRALSSTELLSYGDVDTKEKLQAVYNAGTPLAITGTLYEGATYTAKVDGKFYIFTIVSVNETSNDNLDYYEINIKEAI